MPLLDPADKGPAEVLHPADLALGQEQFQTYRSVTGRVVTQYDYRDHDGLLFSCISADLELARMRRDHWRNQKNRPEVAYA